MKIGIRFKDNDFYYCFTGVLKTLLEANKWYCSLCLDKEKLAIIINEISYGCYLLFQNQFDYGEQLNTIAVSEDLKKYLKITSKDILIDEEVDTFLKQEYLDTIFILNTDLDYEGNDPIHCIL